ncbi:MAG: phage transcriptional regulator AlpA [Myxococcales bacterium]|nr:phage transcriptional regulator AlpA [Myxococcales bacterium]
MFAPHMDPVPEFLDEKRFCTVLGISPVTATKWRAKAKGPPFIRVGRLIRYRRTDVDSWLASRTVGAQLPATVLGAQLG